MMRWNIPIETDDGQYKILSDIMSNQLSHNEAVFILENNIRMFRQHYTGYRELSYDERRAFIHSPLNKTRKYLPVCYLITTKKLAVEFYLKFGG